MTRVRRLLPSAALLGLALVGLALAGHWRAAAAQGAEPSATDRDFFEKQVRPLLANRCYKCHGDVKDVKGGLKLTSREAVLKGGENGPAAVAGHPDESPLIKAVKYDELQMPPDGKLSALEIASLTRWVELGLPWPARADPHAAAEPADGETRPDAGSSDFWSFRPVKDYPVPAVKDAAWPQTSIDRFILAELEQKGLAPSPAADKPTFIRRVTFDLIGLPPTPEEIDAFLADRSPEATARLVDRLLASPHYGERWGRHWLDVARYADNRGYAFLDDLDFPWSYTYRDYVIRAFNEDLPYDRFVTEQLAADRLPLGKDKHALTALGFLTIGNVFMNNQHEVIDDRIDVVTRGLMGLTVTCARCHDHKFDPIPTRDYYSLYGVFASSRVPEVFPLFSDPPATDAYRNFEKELHARQQKLDGFMQAKYEDLKKSARARAAEYLLAAHALRGKPKIEDFMLLADGKDLNPTMIVRWQNYLERRSKAPDPVFAPWHALADLAEKDFSAAAAATLAHTVESQKALGINGLVVRALTEKPLNSLADVAARYGELLTAADKLWQEKVNQAAAARQPPPAMLDDPDQEQLRQVFYAPRAPANAAKNDLNELELLPDRPAQGERKKLLKEISDWRATAPGAPPRAMVLEDAPTPYQPHVFLRGNPNNVGRPVPRQFLKLIAGENRRPFHEGSGRLELARAIVDPANPLTARVMVNRIWLHHFGAGLVTTPSDFGRRSDPPTHPELLDHLATTFVRGGWSIKKIHREILLSAAYAQQSNDRPECRAVDPENRLLWRMNRRRLDFEATRDALLAVAGRLDPAIGGPPIKTILEPAATRRTVYGYIDRLNLPGLFRAFDYPSPDSTSPQRDVTVVPQQALFMMNNPLVVAEARALLNRPELSREQDFGRMITRMIRLAYGREPAAEEIRTAREFLGETATPARWEQYAQALLLANEFVFVD